MIGKAVHVLQYHKDNEMYQKKISISSATGIQRELNSFNIGCDAQPKSEYICINVLYPIISVIPTQLFVTLLVEEKMLNMLSLSGAPPNFFLCSTPSWLRVAPDKTRANRLIRQGSGKKNNPCRESTSPPPFLRLPQPTEGGDERSRRTYKCGDEEQLVKMVDDKQKAPCGWKN